MSLSPVCFCFAELSMPEFTHTSFTSHQAAMRDVNLAHPDLSPPASPAMPQYNMSIATHQELLQQAVYRAASVLPPPPPFQDTDASSPPLHPQNQSAPGNFSPPRRPSSTNGGRRSSGAVPLPPRREDLLPTLAQRLRPLAQPRDHLASLERVITGCRSGGATGSGAAASPSASSGRPSSAKAGGKSRPASARAGSGAGSPLGAAAAPKRPASAGAAQAVKASAFSSASNYKNIVFTQSPMRGHAPRESPWHSVGCTT